MDNSLLFLKRGALAFALACVLPFLTYQGICTFYPERVALESQITAPVEEETASSSSNEISYYKHFFYIQFIVSCCFLLIGFASSLEFLAAGWIMGGIVTMISGLLIHWRYLSSPILFTSLLIFLAFIIVGSYREKALKRSQ